MLDYRTLINRIKSNDDVAFSILYEQTRYAVFAFLYPLLQNQQAIEDVMQETYIKAIANLAQYHNQSHFKTWLLAIAKNSALDYIRRQKNVNFVDIDNISPPYENGLPTIILKMESEHYLSILNTEEKTIVLLKIVDDMTHQEIAKIVHKPLGTVIWLYNRAIRKMQKVRKEEDVDEVQY